MRPLYMMTLTWKGRWHNWIKEDSSVAVDGRIEALRIEALFRCFKASVYKYYVIIRKNY